jgi:glycosyltransferase involved in cell wall biosynthesis
MLRSVKVPVKIIICGDGVDMPWFRNEIARLNLQNSIFTPGFIKPTELGPYLELADLFIFPFKLTQAAIDSNTSNTSVGLWKQLLPIDNAFDQTHKIPNITVEGKKYILVD